MISVQVDDFDMAFEYQQLIANNTNDGAVVTFSGLVRDFSPTLADSKQAKVTGMTLEHYPGMTEKALADIVNQAKARWQLGRVRVIHRVGKLTLSEQIVFVGVTSCHRQAAFEAAQFIMDYLKNQAPFWKKEHTTAGDKWVEFNSKDLAAQQRWE